MSPSRNSEAVQSYRYRDVIAQRQGDSAYERLHNKQDFHRSMIAGIPNVCSLISQSRGHSFDPFIHICDMKLDIDTYMMDCTTELRILKAARDTCGYTPSAEPCDGHHRSRITPAHTQLKIGSLCKKIYVHFGLIYLATIAYDYHPSVREISRQNNGEPVTFLGNDIISP